MGSPAAVVKNVIERVILFDGVCNLCHGAVLFTIRHDKHNSFRFASLQSSFGQRQLQRFNLDAQHLKSILLLEGDTIKVRSDAALAIARRLDGAWKLFYIFKVVPKFIRDSIYNVIARYRYVWFGKREACMIPTPELSEKFIE